MIYLENNELYHHGVKGQKWGVIRKRLEFTGRSIGNKKRSLARTTIHGAKYVESVLAKQRSKRKEIKESVKNTKKKDPSKMSDAELISANARLKLENTYLTLYNNRYPERESKAQKFVEDSLQKLGNKAVSSMQTYMENVAKNAGTNNSKSNTNNKKQLNNNSQNKQYKTRTEELNARIIKLNGVGNPNNSNKKKKKKKDNNN